MPWPLSQDYNEAMQNLAVNFSDLDLRQAEPRTNAFGLPVPCSGNFADVYQVRNAGRAWAVKCFTRESAGLRERYVEIGAHLQAARLPSIIAFEYIDRCVRIRDRRYPVLKMDWVEGFALNYFVKENLDKPHVLKKLADLWVELARQLREAKIAHGDLQHGNILLGSQSNSEAFAIRLVDYDGMFVPGLAGHRSGEVGHPAYQHPHRLRDGTFSAEVDRFPLLVIYCAIRALMVRGRALWDRYDNGDNLLFREEDLRSPRESALFWELVRLNEPDVRRLADCLSRAVYKPLEQTPLLDELTRHSPESESIPAVKPDGRGTPLPTKSLEPNWAIAPPPVRSQLPQATTPPTASPEPSWVSAPPSIRVPNQQADTPPPEAPEGIFGQATDDPLNTPAPASDRTARFVRRIVLALIVLCCFGIGILIWHKGGIPGGGMKDAPKIQNNGLPPPRKQDHAVPKKDAEAAPALGEKGPKAAVNVRELIDRLRHVDPIIRADAAQKIGELGKAAAEGRSALVDTLGDPDAQVSAAATKALSSLPPATKADVADLRRALKEPNAKVRTYALDTLGEIGPEAHGALKEVLAALKDKEPACRSAAAGALGAIGDSDEMVNALVEAMKDQEPEVRRSAVRSLAALRPAPRESVRALIAALDDRDGEVSRRAVAGVKVAQLSKEDVTALGNLLKDGDPDGRANAASVLAVPGLDARSVKPTLIGALEDKDKRVRQQAAEALGNMKGEAWDASTKLAVLLDDKESEVRRSAIAALARIAPDVSEDAVLKLIRVHRDPALHDAISKVLVKIGKKAVESLIDKLKDNNDAEKIQACRLLGEMGAEAADAIEALSGLAQEKSQLPNVRKAAEEALKKIRR